jgi:hypothetical protein
MDATYWNHCEDKKDMAEQRLFHGINLGTATSKNNTPAKIKAVKSIPNKIKKPHPLFKTTNDTLTNRESPKRGKTMFSFLKNYPTAKLEKELMKKMAISVEFQRNGKIKEYAEASKEISDLQDKLDALRAAS